MSELTYTVPLLSTQEELELAIQCYKTSDLSGLELLMQWQAIRDACLDPSSSDSDGDKVPGQDSY